MHGLNGGCWGCNTVVDRDERETFGPALDVSDTNYQSSGLPHRLTVGDMLAISIGIVGDALLREIVGLPPTTVPGPSSSSPANILSRTWCNWVWMRSVVVRIVEWSSSRRERRPSSPMLSSAYCSSK